MSKNRPPEPEKASLCSFAHRLSRTIGSVAAILVAAYLGGFFFFTTSLDRVPPPDLAAADGIVALTGGPDRIRSAYRLLEQGKGQRLLISGVHQEVDKRELQAVVKGGTKQFDCCVDLGMKAINTVGNAAETAAWVHEHGYRRIIVVTSVYHLPRALVELRRSLPGTELVGYPVFQDTLHLDDWWSYPGTTRLLIGEYTKYLITLAHFGPTASQ
ncbi:MAG: ElyC/SanA/YdcF family protein [Parvibaculaceae bacterium]|nr:ElyC/SanA/YdcF family protein [Parvibaculaceae bacterium]